MKYDLEQLEYKIFKLRKLYMHIKFTWTSFILLYICVKSKFIQIYNFLQVNRKSSTLSKTFQNLQARTSKFEYYLNFHTSK